MADASDDVIVERHGAVLLVRLNRTGRFNSIGGTMLQDVGAAFDEAAQDDQVRVVVTTGQGGSFCSGADVADFPNVAHLPARQLLNSDQIGGLKGLAALSPNQASLDELGNAGRWMLNAWRLEKPTIAAVNGAAIGGGLALALLHDIRIAAASAKFGAGFTQAGLAPEMGVSLLLPQLIGSALAAEFLLTGRIVDGTNAAQWGLASEVVPDEDLLTRSLELAERIAKLPTLALQLTKRLLRRATVESLTQQLRAEHSAQITLFDDPNTRAALDELTRRVAGAKA